MKNNNKNRKYGKAMSFPKTVTPEGKMQDWMWYAEDQLDLVNMARIPFTGQLGERLPLTSIAKAATYGIMRFEYKHRFGCQTGTVTGFAKAARKYFDQVARAFAGFPNVEAADVFFAVLVQQSLVEWIHEAKRVYPIISKVSKWNKFKGNPLIKALGFSVDEEDSITNNIADFRTQVNKRISMFNDFCVVPDGLAAVNRAEYYTSQVFTDVGNFYKDNFIIYVPTDYMMLDVTSMNTGTAIKALPAAHSEMGLEEFLNYFDTMYEVLANNQDVINIFQVLGRVYGEDKLVKFTKLNIEEEFSPVHSDVAMNIYHNIVPIAEGRVISAVPKAYFVGHEADANATISDIIAYQTDKSVPSCATAYFKNGGTGVTNMQYYDYGTGSYLLDVLSTSSGTPEEVIDVTSQMATLGEFGTFTTTTNGIAVNTALPASDLAPLYCRDTVITEIKVYGPTSANDDVTQFLSYTKDALSSLANAFSQFNFAPHLISSNTLHSELVNYTLVPGKTLRNMHELSQFKLFAVPVATGDIIK